ncbi:MAG: DMT family transporter [Acidobacteria bacterium]|nr:DMT family transporter [Acidobacteriota bacterium]
MTAGQMLNLAVVTVTASCGDTFLARGMKSVGPVSIHHLGELIHAVLTPWVGAGIVVLIGFFASYLTALSWADLTYVLPATSIGYVIMELLGHFWLREYVSPWRWLGIVFITAGVGFVARGPSYTHTHQSEPEQQQIEEGQHA